MNVSGTNGLRSCKMIVGVALLLGPVLAPGTAEAATEVGHKPSQAPLVAVGQHYFGNTDRAEVGPGDGVDLWRLPPLLTSDVLSVVTNATGSEWPTLCLTQDVDDYDWTDGICNASERFYVSSGSARSLIQVRSATSTALLEFEGEGCCEWGSQAYDFTIESIQHAVGTSLQRVRRIRPTARLKGWAVLSNGAPVPDGTAFTLTASWVTPVNRARHHRDYGAISSGGRLTFPVRLPKSAWGKRVAFVLSRRADALYLASRSPVLKVRAVKRSRCRRGLRKRRVRGKVRCVHRHRKHKQRPYNQPV